MGRATLDFSEKTTIGTIEFSKPKHLHFEVKARQSGYKYGNLDIEGSGPGSAVPKFVSAKIRSIEYVPKLITRTDDVLGARAGSLLKGIKTNRNLNPLAPNYLVPGHMQDRDLMASQTAQRFAELSQNDKRKLLLKLRDEKFDAMASKYEQLRVASQNPVAAATPQNRSHAGPNPPWGPPAKLLASHSAVSLQKRDFKNSKSQQLSLSSSQLVGAQNLSNKSADLLSTHLNSEQPNREAVFDRQRNSNLANTDSSQDVALKNTNKLNTTAPIGAQVEQIRSGGSGIPSEETKGNKTIAAEPLEQPVGLVPANTASPTLDQEGQKVMLDTTKDALVQDQVDLKLMKSVKPDGLPGSDFEFAGRRPVAGDSLEPAPLSKERAKQVKSSLVLPALKKAHTSSNPNAMTQPKTLAEKNHWAASHTSKRAQSLPKPPARFERVTKHQQINLYVQT